MIKTKKLTAKAAFTLAETLIALAVIGIVAALTIPTLVQKYKERVIVTKVKAFYSIFSQAYQLAILENGTLDQWGLKGFSKVDNEDGSYYISDESAASVDKFYQTMMSYLKYASYVPIDANNYGVDADNNEYGIIGTNRGLLLANGIRIVSVYIYPDADCSKGPCGDFYIVTDGGDEKEKRSDGNMYHRKETFCFRLYKDKVTPLTISADNFKSSCINGNNYSRCTEWVIKNGNMDYLHCDDLDINNKTKCN